MPPGAFIEGRDALAVMPVFTDGTLKERASDQHRAADVLLLSRDILADIELCPCGEAAAMTTLAASVLGRPS